MRTHHNYINILLLFITSISCLMCTPAFSDSSYPESYIKNSIDSFEKTIIVPVKSINPGGISTVKYGDFVVHIYRRTPQDIISLKKISSPDIITEDQRRWKEADIIWKQGTLSNIRNYVIRESQKQFSGFPFRSIKDEIFVVIGEGLKNGFHVKYLPPNFRNNQSEIFMNVVYGQRYDSAGRQLSESGVTLNNGENLLIPPYSYNKDGDIVLGGININRETAITKPNYRGLSVQQKLWLACKNNDYSSVVDALSGGANPNLKEDMGNALDYAITGSDLRIIKLLLNARAQPTNISREIATIAKRDDILLLLEGLEK